MKYKDNESSNQINNKETNYFLKKQLNRNSGIKNYTIADWAVRKKISKLDVRWIAII